MCKRGPFGLPCRSARIQERENRIRIIKLFCVRLFINLVEGLEIDAFSRSRIDASAAELVEERDAVRELGLLP